MPEATAFFYFFFEKCGLGSFLPSEKRKALRQSGITYKQLRAQIKSARTLSGFLGRLQQEPRIVAANRIHQEYILLWRKDLEDAATFLESLVPFRPDTTDAALALALYVERQSGQRHERYLPEICKLLNAALGAAGQESELTPETLRRSQIARGNRQRAEDMLRSWESLAPAKKAPKVSCPPADKSRPISVPAVRFSCVLVRSNSIRVA